MEYYLYILKTMDDTLYTGISKDVIRRFSEHLNDPKRGAKYTKAHKPQKIVYLNVYENKSLASKEEYRIKKTLTKRDKLELIVKHQNRTEKLLKKLIVK